MYHLSYWHYHDQINKINMLCLYWPIATPRLILDCIFNHWILDIAHHTPQYLEPLFECTNQIIGDLCH